MQTDYQYKSLQSNVNVLKLIQLGISFYDAKGNVPTNVCSWQFNFKFNLKTEMFSEDSIQLLSRSGIQFQRHETVYLCIAPAERAGGHRCESLCGALHLQRPCHE
jgi:hypothetical protein